MGVPAEKRPWLRLVGTDDGYADWDAIYLDNVGWLYRMLFGKVGNRQDAEDLTTEVFLNALPRLRENASQPEVRAYLVATARSTLASHWRKTLGREVTTIEVDERSGEVVGPPGATGEEAGRKVGAILGRLPERYRRILELRFLEACSLREAAAELGISVGNAKVLQHRALKRAAELGQEA